MLQGDIIHFDIAAVVVMLVSLASLLFRNLTKGAANRVYLSCMVLVTLTTLAGLFGEMYDAFISPALVAPSAAGADSPPMPPGAEYPLALRNAVTIVYYSLRSLTAPAYLILITVVSDTSHRLNSSNLRRFLLWVPMTAVILIVATNPFHHLIFTYENGVASRGPWLFVLYLDALYYSLIGAGWLLRWRSLLSSDEFATLMLLYPIVLAAVVVQYFTPGLRIEMFVTAVAMMLVSAFVVHPETRQDALVDAESLHAYNEMCRRAFATDKQMCLIYVEIINGNKLRELLGKGELEEATRRVAVNLTATFERDQILYYLRNGLFCIAGRAASPERAARIAQRAFEEGAPEPEEAREKAATPQLRVCTVNVPEDVASNEALSAFVGRIGHLVPQPGRTSYAELSQRADFGVQMALSSIIRRSIDNQSFQVYYQPICCLKDGRFHSAEALVRLNDPAFGWVSPGLFIPEAEQSGAIVDIGHILLEKICAFLSEVDYKATGLDYVEVNLSVEQCIRPSMADELDELMRTHCVAPARVNLEITETSAAYSQQVIDENVRKLAKRGVTFSLDDYGTGYSNIARALSLPFSIVKLDKSFVDGLDDFATRTVLADTVTMLKAIGKDVLVEGVETSEQLSALAAMGVDYIQGYHFARPMPQDEFLAFLRVHNA